MNWSLVALVVAMVVLTIFFWFKHHGDMLYGRVIDTVAQRNKLVLKHEEREWCLSQIRSRWLLLTFLGFISVTMKFLFPGDEGDESDDAMLEAAAVKCEDSLVHLLMHYRQDHPEP